MNACTEELFLKDVAHHKMTVIRDDGVHRHVQFRQPGTFCMGFDLITWPGHLCYCGDMGTYVFNRLEDMFEFFRTEPKNTTGLHINLSYWAEKLHAIDRHSPATEYSEDAFIAAINRWLEDSEPSDELLEAVKEEILDHDNAYEWDARGRADSFEHGGRAWFQDFCEANLHEYTFRFIWCCYAIAWGIKQYDALKVPMDMEFQITVTNK